MMPLTNEKPAGGNLRVGDVDSTVGAVPDSNESTPAPPDCKPLDKSPATQWQASDDAMFELAGEHSSREFSGGIHYRNVDDADLRDDHDDAESQTMCEMAVDRDRDNRGIRDTARHERPRCPGLLAHLRDNQDKPHGERFELFLDRNGFRDGVYWIGLEKDSGDELPPAWICSPLVIAAMTRDGAGNEWGRWLLFFDRDGREHRWAMPMGMLAGSGEELRAELLRQGLEITSDTRHRKRLLDYIQWPCESISARCVSKTGWDGDVFVLPAKTYGDTEREPVIFQTSAPDGIALSQAGTLADWRAGVAAPCAGNSRLVLALSIAFAAPCLGLVGAEGGGFHLRGGSSSGKTTALNIAASVCGPPRYMRTWRQTDNALEGIASLHSDLPLVLDEMGQLDPKVSGQCAYLLANGQGKGRARRDGAPRAPATFRVLFLSAGEVGLAELVAQSGGQLRAGQEVRVIDIPSDAGAGFGLFDLLPNGIAAGAFADQLKAAAAAHYGHALPAFLEALVADIGHARDWLQRARNELADSLAVGLVDGQVRRVAQRFAVIGAAGELVTHYGLTGWPIGEATRAVAICFLAWLDARGTNGNAEPVAMLAQVRRFLTLHGEARFTDWFADGQGPRTVNRAGYKKNSKDGYEYFIEREVFRKEVIAGFDYRAVTRMLLDCGALKADSDGSATRKERLPDGNVRVYHVLPAIWDVEL